MASSYSSLGLESESMNFQQVSMILFFPVGIIIGLITAWWSEGIGGGIVLLSLIGFYISSYVYYGVFPEGSHYIEMSSPGILFIFYSIATYNTRHRNAYL
jgi:hypothetical protein